MRIMLLGGTGYLGSNIVNYLSERDCEVYCVVRRTSNLEYLRRTYHPVGSRNFEGLS